MQSSIETSADDGPVGDATTSAVGSIYEAGFNS